jgi:hypothetical protein
MPPTETTTFPVVAPVGTEATIEEPFQLVIVVAMVPLNATVLLPWIDPKFEPLMVIDVPTAAMFVESCESWGVPVNGIPLLSTPLAKTTRLPVVGPVGTVASIEVLLQLVMFAPQQLPANNTAPCDVLKLFPEMVTAVPGGPEVGDILLMTGAGTTVKIFPLLALPLTVTTTFPVVAPVGTVT